MKKVLKYLIALALILPVSVKADVMMPIMDEYKGIVSNPSGAECYDVEGEKTGATRSYTTDLLISYEYTKDGVTYLYTDDYTHEEVCFLKSSDVSISNNSISDESLTKVSGYFYVSKSPVILREGPSSGFDSVKEVPVGSVLKKKETTDYEWYQVELEDGTTGWVNTLIYADTIELYYKKDFSVITLSRYNCLYTEPINTANVITLNIPVNTKLEATSLTDYIADGYVMVEVSYKGKTGYLRVDNVTNMAAIERFTDVDSKSILIVEKGIKLYDKPNGTLQTNVSLDIEKEYEAQYEVFDRGTSNLVWYSVSVNNKLYYFNSQDETSKFLEKNPTKFARITKDVELVSLTDTTKVINTLSTDDVIAYYYTYSIPSNRGLKTYIYVKDLGFIKPEDYYNVEVIDASEVPNYEETIGFDGYIVEIDKNEETTVKKEDNHNKLSVKEIFIGIIIVVIVLALTVTVILVIINKKNKKEVLENEETNEDSIN